jgi:hypothetical protein
MKAKMLIAGISILSIFLISCGGGATGKQTENTTTKSDTNKEIYTCPMHPEVKSDKPGKCPTCGMELEKKTN